MTPDFGHAVGFNKFSTEEKITKGKCEKKESDGTGNVMFFWGKKYIILYF